MTNPRDFLVDPNGKKYPIGERGLSIGRHSQNDIKLSEAGVSRLHARLIPTAQGIYVRDENSANGTYVNGNRIVGQQLLKPGDTLQVGSAHFQLVTSAGAAAAGVAGSGGQAADRPVKRPRLILVGMGSAALLLVVLFFGMGGGKVDMSRFLSPTNTAVPTAVAVIPQATVTVLPPTLAPAPTGTSEPGREATITCADLDSLQARHECVVTNLGLDDILWLSFQPLLDAQERGYALSVVLPGQKDPVYPNRRGRVSLGAFTDGESRSIAVQMYCVKPEEGCPEFSVQVQVYVDDGLFPVDSPQGIVVIRNAAAGSGVRPTRRTAEEDTPVPQLDTAVPATATATISDIGGGTPNP